MEMLLDLDVHTKLLKFEGCRVTNEESSTKLSLRVKHDGLGKQADEDVRGFIVPHDPR